MGKETARQKDGRERSKKEKTEERKEGARWRMGGRENNPMVVGETGNGRGTSE